MVLKVINPRCQNCSGHSVQPTWKSFELGLCKATHQVTACACGEGELGREQLETVVPHILRWHRGRDRAFQRKGSIISEHFMYMGTREGLSERCLGLEKYTRSQPCQLIMSLSSTWCLLCVGPVSFDFHVDMVC